MVLKTELSTNNTINLELNLHQSEKLGCQRHNQQKTSKGRSYKVIQRLSNSHRFRLISYFKINDEIKQPLSLMSVSQVSIPFPIIKILKPVMHSFTYKYIIKTRTNFSSLVSFRIQQASVHINTQPLCVASFILVDTEQAAHPDGP